MSEQVFTPRLVEEATYSTARRRHLVDVGFLVSIMVMMLALIPAPLVVPSLSDLGHPAAMMSLVICAVWGLSRTYSRFVTRGAQPMRWIMIFYFTTVLTSYAAGQLRGLSTLEDNAAIRAIISILGFCGVALAMADGVHSRERIAGVIRVMLLGGALMAAIGITQALLTFDITIYIQIPGLEYHSDLSGLAVRGEGHYRVNSTAGHYIEFSTIMAMLLPFAVHMGLYAPTRPMRQWSGIAGGLMFLALPMAISRTGIVALAIALIVMIPAWSWRIRFNIVVPAVGLLIALIFVTPGLLRTVLGLFVDWDNDVSVQARVADWQLIQDKGWMNGHWLLGRGHGTFIPTVYTWLDNQWLQQLVGGGIIGVIALATIHIGTITMLAIAHRRSPRPADRHLCACLISTQMIAIAVASTFDSLGFRTYALFLAVLTGAAAAMWRLTAPPGSLETAQPTSQPRGARLGRRALYR